MYILGVDQEVRKGTYLLAHSPDRQAAPETALDTYLPSLHEPAFGYNLVRQAQCSVEFQGSCLHPQGA
jgi:hypothetical protein